MVILEEKQTRDYKLELLDNSVVYLLFNEGCEINLIKAKKLRDEVLKLVKGKSFKTIIDFRNVSSVTTVETRKFMSNNENFNNLKLCDSFITNSYTTSMLIGFYLKIFKPAVVTKSFSTFGDALDWVEKF